VDTVERMMGGPRGREQSGSKGVKGKGKGKESEDERAVAMRRDDDYNARAIRHSIRVFVATGTLMKLWGMVSARLMGKKQEYAISICTFWSCADKLT
jgi:hypothetical protein